MLLLTIATVLTIILMIIVYIIKTEKSKRSEFTSLSTLLQTLFVFITLWITIYTIRSNNSDTKNLFDNLQKFNSQFSQMEASLGNVSDKLKEMPILIKSFANSIDSLNIGIERQKKDFQANTKDLNKTIKDLSVTVQGYEQNINNYSKQLKTVVGLTNEQLIIWKEQQRVLLDEFSRKPLLKIGVKNIKFNSDTCEINDLIISNDGNIEANTRVIFLFFPTDGFINVNSNMFIFYKNVENDKTYRLFPIDTNAEIIAAGSDIILPCTIKILKKYKDNIRYRIDYFSKYKSGKVVDKLNVK
jgi:hypothetical protein